MNLLKNWILYERSEEQRFIVVPTNGIKDCCLTEEEVYILLGEHERTSVSLSVSDEYKKLFTEFKDYINKENEYICDENLGKEIEVIDILVM